MAEIPKVITLKVELDQPALREAIEQIIETAFRGGFEQGLAQAEQEPGNRMVVEQSYEDWRGFGPGQRMPGGREYRYRVASDRNAGRAQRRRPAGGSGQARAQ